jgi:glycosyltransferase involved in cell wall biosynthesis
MIHLSAVIITYNEARNIGRCLDSLTGVADEIVVLDSFSTDQTAEICQKYPVRFIQHAFDGHIEQKNRALTLASHAIVLSLDADEALDEVLRQSILEAKSNWQAHAYSMNRLTNYCGQWIRHSGWYPDRKVRLFDRREGQWGGVNPHDKVEMKAGSNTIHLKGDLLHYSYYSVAEHYARARKYADIAAKAMCQQGKKSAWWMMFISPFAKFIRNYFIKTGFLDGRAGLTIAWISALETYLKYRNLKKCVDKQPASAS